MKVLVVASANRGGLRPFVADQVQAIREAGCDIDLYEVHGHGLFGYVRHISGIRKALNQKKYDVVHAHYGLCGFLCVWQKHVPVVVTYHGLDLPDAINEYSRSKNKAAHFFSKIAFRRAAWNILTHKGMSPKGSAHTSVIPCGVSTDFFIPIEKEAVRKELELSSEKKYVLFSGSFNDPVKNYALAKLCVENLENTELISLSGYSREDVVKLLSACDVLLVTSHYETGPLIVKEALACNCPVVSVDVGDVRKVLADAESCYVVEPNATALKDALEKVLSENERPITRKIALQFSNLNVANEILKVYSHLADVSTLS